MSDSKHVQTELSPEEYHHFKALADERSLSLTAALREATELWIEEQTAIDDDDPLFSILNTLENVQATESLQTNAAAEPDLVEEWQGNAMEIELTESTKGDE